MADPPQPDVERLYGLDLNEFTSSRDATSRRLRREGRKDEADAVKALRKPSNAAWVVNRLARDSPGVVAELLAAGRGLRDVQLGAGGGEELRVAMDLERRALDRAMRNAEEIATHAGLATRSTLERVRETLHLAAIDLDVAADVERGVVVREGQATGFIDLAAAAPGERPAHKLSSSARPRTAAKSSSAQEQKQQRDRQEESKRRAEELAEARRQGEAAEQELEAAERELERARAELQKAKERADEARRQRAAAKSKTARMEAASHRTDP